LNPSQNAPSTRFPPCALQGCIPSAAFRGIPLKLVSRIHASPYHFVALIHTRARTPARPHARTPARHTRKHKHTHTHTAHKQAPTTHNHACNAHAHT
jgi:hypothetical protein